MSEVVLNRLQRNLKIINFKKHKYVLVSTGKYNDKKLKLNEIHDLIYELAMELITWLVNTDDLLYKNFDSYKKAKKKDRKFNNSMFGLRHAFNLFKHDMSILSVEEKKYTLQFQKEEDNYYNEKIIWLNVDGITVLPEHKNAMEAYKGYLEGKTLFETFNYIVNTLDEYSMEILKENKTSNH